MIMKLVSGDISAFMFAFMQLASISRVYKPVDRTLWFVDTMARASKTQVIHRKPHTCQQRISPFEHLFQHMVIVVDLGMFLA